MIMALVTSKVAEAVCLVDHVFLMSTRSERLVVTLY